MNTLVDVERLKYEDAWTLDKYAQHSPGEMFLPVLLEMLQHYYQKTPADYDSVLDAGCGSGKGMLALQKAGFTYVRGVDITPAGLVPEARDIEFHTACLWDSPIKQNMGFADLVYCCDVMEHIPTAFTMLVVSRLLEIAKQALFLSISLVPDTMGYWIGKPLHETVQSFVWWRDHLATIGKLIEGRDLLTSAAFLVEPK